MKLFFVTISKNMYLDKILLWVCITQERAKTSARLQSEHLNVGTEFKLSNYQTFLGYPTCIFSSDVWSH